MELISGFYELFLQRFWRDDIPFSTSITRCLVAASFILGFWIAWSPVAALVAIMGFLFNGAAGSGVEHDVHMFWRGMLYLFIFCSLLTVPVGIWRSTAKYVSVKHSAPSAILVATACAFAAVLSLAAAGELALVMSRMRDGDMRDVHNSRRTSKNVVASLDRSPAFPLTGFWQVKCGDDSGVAIERESRWLKGYRLEDCGTNDCSRLRAATNIIDDPNYRVVDQNTIEFNAAADPGNRQLLHRCG